MLANWARSWLFFVVGKDSFEMASLQNPHFLLVALQIVIAAHHGNSAIADQRGPEDSVLGNYSSTAIAVDGVPCGKIGM